MNRETFNQGFATLFNAYTYSQERMTTEAEEVYWMMLKDVPDGLWLKGVKECLANCKFFPSIHELGTACCGEREVVTDPFAHLTPWIKPPTKTITWQENLERILSGGRKAIEARKLVEAQAARDGAGEWEPPEVRAARK